MSSNKPIFFFRNDDVRESLDESLIRLTDLFLKHEIPLAHAVEPANVSKEVSDWLLGLKKTHPELIEIIQHGYDHNHQQPSRKMEFGGKRTYNDQLTDIMKGKNLMNKYFDDLWDPIFTFPYGTFNEATIKALDESGYLGFSSKIKFELKSRFKDKSGRLLGRNTIFKRMVSYHPGRYSSYSLKEISVSVNPIRTYINSIEAIHYPFSEIHKQIKTSIKYTRLIGVLLHHRYHNNYLDTLEEILLYIRENKYKVSDLNTLFSHI